MKNLLIPLLLAAPVFAVDYTFVGGNNGSDNWSDPDNWDSDPTPWSSTDRAIIPAGKTAIYNAVLGATGDYPTVVIEDGGTLRWPSSGPDHFYSPVTLEGGTFDLRKTLVNIHDAFDVVEDSTISFDLGNDPSHFWGPFTGDKTLTFNGVNSVSASSWGNTVRLRAECPDFTGLINVVPGRIHVETPSNATSFPNATVRVGTNGVWVVRYWQTTPIILDGGALRGGYSGMGYSGPITLKADSHIDTINWATMSVTSVITGEYNLITGAAVPNGGELGNGTIRLAGDFSNWSGDFVAKTHYGNRIFVNSGHLPNGALITPDGAGILLDANGVWTLQNDMIGPWDIRVGGDTWIIPSNHTVTFDGSVIAPAQANNDAGTLVIDGRLILTNTTVNLRRLGPQSFDKITVNSASNPAIIIRDSTLNLTLNYDETSPAEILILENKTGTAIMGEFNGMAEGATVDLGNGRSAFITYLGGPNNNSIALYDFATSAQPAPPQVATLAATDIDYRTATLNAQVTAAFPVPEAFFCYGTNNVYSAFSTNAWEHVVSVGEKSGAYSLAAADLEHGATYYVAAFAASSEGVAWGNLQSFNTLAANIHRWENIGWNDNNEAYRWGSSGFWNPSVPNFASDVGYVGAGMTAAIYGNLGAATGNRPYIIAEAGGTLFLPPNGVQNTETPIELRNATLRWATWNLPSIFAPIRLVGSCVFDNINDTGTGPGVHSPLSSGPGAIITTYGALSIRGENSAYFGDWHIGGGNISLHTSSALGNGSVHLLDDTPVARLSQSFWSYSQQSLTLARPVSGFGELSARGNSVTLQNTVTPGDADTCGTLTVISRKFTLDGAALNINLRTANDTSCLSVANPGEPGTPPDVEIKNTVLKLNDLAGFKAGVGDVFVLLRNTGVNKIDGEFADYPEGKKVKLGGIASGTITYKHAIGSDLYNIAITNIRPNGTLFLLK